MARHEPVDTMQGSERHQSLSEVCADRCPVDHPLEEITDQREWTLMAPLKECQETPLPFPSQGSMVLTQGLP